ncbi:MAG: HD domain-containing protein, partial [Phycisphaeraceae bacterium]
MTTTQRIYLRDMAPAQLVQGVFAIHNCQLGMTRTGKPYLRCLVGDRTARKPGRMWSASEELYNSLPTDGFVFLEGETQPYQGEMQIIIRSIEPYTPTANELRDLLPCTEHDIDQMFADVVNLLHSMRHEPLKCLADRYLEDGELMDKFCQAPAAMSLHHAYLGGLLEHTLSVMRLAEQVVPLYPNLSRDVILMGLFIHDLGKCSEQTWEQGFGYSTDGQLVGHIARGSLWLEDKARACQQLEEGAMTIPAPLLRVLHHIILSHHGVPEFGALKIPATPEALAVSLIDNLDAKMNMALTASRTPPTPAEAENDLGGDFTEKLWALNNTRYYRPDP